MKVCIYTTKVISHAKNGVCVECLHIICTLWRVICTHSPLNLSKGFSL